MTEDEMIGWHHRLSGHEFEQTQGDSVGQGGLVCCCPWGRKESDRTEWLNDSKEFSCHAEHLGSIPGLGRHPRGGHGNSLQYS